MLAFNRVPPVPALALTGSAQPLGKVNANAGWLVHMPHSVSVSLTVSLRLHLKLLVALFQSYLILSHIIGEIFNNKFSRCKTEVRKAPLEYFLASYLAQGHFSRAGVC